VKLLFALSLLIIFVLGFTACGEHLVEPSSAQEIAQEITQEPVVDFIAQSASHIYRIAIVLNPNWLDDIWLGELTTLYMTEQEGIEHLYNLLAGVEVTYVNTHPAHYQSIQSDAEFMIAVEYNDGLIDEFYGYIRWGKEIVRFLDTRGPQNDPGFIVGKNEKVWEFIDYIRGN